ncbi:hypothetical protein Bca4012_076830 [Brassica carinata]|uniref:CUE domain-containing protein n=1 Tax=Brassica carinata TaxID=52824 RepID=A0A8X7QEC2_BRACI|nr:hypothetical protein Bca52824_072903 [Brassica carinata]
MSAVVCGSKRSLFDDLSSATSSPPVSKKLRSSRFSSSLLFDHLAAIFPGMDNQTLERAIEECGDDIDSAIRSLNQLRLESANQNPEPSLVQEQAKVEVGGGGGSEKEQVLNLDGTEWVEFFVREMMSASNMNDAKDRASRALEALEKSIKARAGADAAMQSSLQQENSMLRQQLEAMVQENSLLKRAVVTQQKRQRETEDQSQELQGLRQMVSQYQEQLRTLEVNNYALTLHLKQAQQNNSSIPGRFHPDVF